MAYHNTAYQSSSRNYGRGRRFSTSAPVWAPNADQFRRLSPGQTHEQRASLDAKVEVFKAEHADVCAWIERKKNHFDFAGSLAGALNRYGCLTDRQIDAVRRCMEKDEQFARDREAREANAPACSVLAIETAFATASNHGIGTPKLYFAEFRFSPAGQRSANPGAIYVKNRESGEYLGKIANGRFVRARGVEDGTESAILATCEDPYNAAIAYGKRFGVCACCNRTLSDPESIERGIGPVCAKHYFDL